MTDVIVTFKIKDLLDYTQGTQEMNNEDINDMLEEIGQKNEMDLVSWGTI